MKKLITIALAAGLMAGVSQAALQANWAAPGVQTMPDNPGDTLDIGTLATDILSLQYSHQNGGQGWGHYFLITLAGVPTNSDYAPSYMINIDYQPGGGSSGNSFFVAGGLVGIDMIVDTHYDFGQGFTDQHQLDYIGGPTPQFNKQPLASYGGSFDSNLPLPLGGDQLEWFIPDSLLGAGAKVYASTLNAEPGGDTFDITGYVTTVVPEPTSMALLALGMAALGLKRKRS